MTQTAEKTMPIDLQLVSTSLDALLFHLINMDYSAVKASINKIKNTVEMMRRHEEYAASKQQSRTSPDLDEILSKVNNVEYNGDGEPLYCYEQIVAAIAEYQSSQPRQEWDKEGFKRWMSGWIEPKYINSIAEYVDKEVVQPTAPTGS